MGWAPAGRWSQEVRGGESSTVQDEPEPETKPVPACDWRSEMEARKQPNQEGRCASCCEGPGSARKGKWHLGRSKGSLRAEGTERKGVREPSRN